VETADLCMPYADDIGGTLRGYRIFTACRTVNGKIFRIKDHLDRLYNSAAGIFMNPPLTRKKLSEVLQETISRNQAAFGQADLILDIIFSGGLEGATMQQSGNPAHLYVAVERLVPPPEELYKTGAALATFVHQRMYADIKLLNYVGAIIAHQTVAPIHKAWDVLFLCPSDGRTVLEGSTFTVFCVDSQKTVCTPPLDGRILDSVTRRVVLEILRSEPEMKLRESPLELDEFCSCPECFLASTTRNVLPVTRIDDKIIGNGMPGPVTEKLSGLFRSYLESY
jgi:branched-chain amino acid aminotransferase